MFARNEKYGQALHLQYGPASSAGLDDTAVNRHFGVASLLQSLRKSICLTNRENAVEVDLEQGPLGKAVTNGCEITGDAVNENSFNPKYIRNIH